MSSKVRAVAGAAVIVGAIVLLVVLKSNNSGNVANTDGGKLQTIVVKNGKPVGGIRQLTYNKGERILFKVMSDIPEEVHLHGYDVMKDVKAGGSVTFSLPASIEGVFEAELEGRKEQIIEMTVHP
jgi:hypothetical protein